MEAIKDLEKRTDLNFEPYSNEDYDYMLRNESIGLKEYVRQLAPERDSAARSPQDCR